MSEMSWVEIYFYVGVVWSLIKLVVSGTELITKKASKSLNLTARVWRQAEIEEVYHRLSKLHNPSIKIAVVSIGILMGVLRVTITWPISVYLFVRDRT